ncbi:DNA repair protein RecN (Recombination protein N) [Kineococcus xinjiangensis]|uniref:DNA repair protein RecN n=1 Tax=Kineococcus xinjiangensis TaxID=512762 RepID=A0A2S6IC89_9ACTN|nr:DNA repair protein RecN [Kineococcus xinjiangensis]PPK90865.1 DNA repair protein RecN (Recombination protein N) [Kineococcus xinjiangensis]
MIEEIRIRELGVIRDARLELQPGLTVLTGETGAGKTMVVTGLGLLLGERADPAAVRRGAGTAVVEGRLLVDPDGPAARRAADAGGDVDEGVLHLARSVAAGGRSRAHVGGRGAPVSVLAELAEHVVAVHGQTDQLRLRAPARQLQVLDAFAGTAVRQPLDAYAQEYAQWRGARAELEHIRTHSRERALEAERLRAVLADVEKLVPQPGEDAQLREEAARLSHVEQLRAAADGAHAALTGGGAELAEGAAGADALIDAARRSLAGAGDHDPALAALAGRLGEVAYLLADVAAEVAAYAAGVEADPARLSAVEERRAELAGLLRRTSAVTGAEDVDAVLAWAEDASRRLLELDDDGRAEVLAEQVRVREQRLAELADVLSDARRTAAAALGGRVSAELAELAMGGARLEVAVRTGADFGPGGRDEVEILLAAHSGATPRPLGRGASGGELSRVMLGLEVVLAGADPVPTMVFDEVDAGVGGRAAVEIGRRLARLARSTQVLVVTHLPQVAAFADHHFTVVKTDDGSVTESGVVLLDEEGRVRELARMLAGRADSTAAREHARELLAASRLPDAPTAGAGPGTEAGAEGGGAGPAAQGDGAEPAGRTRRGARAGGAAAKARPETAPDATPRRRGGRSAGRGGAAGAAPSSPGSVGRSGG